MSFIKNFNFFVNEIKIRLIYILISFLFNVFVIFEYKFEVFFLLINPVLKFNYKFIYTGITDLFITYLYFILFMGFLITIPFIVYILSFFILKSIYNYQI